MSDDLKALRDQIDKVDDQILELLNQRARVVQEVGAIKQRNKESFYVPGRERQIVDRLTQANPGPFPGEAVQPVFQEIISACLKLEEPMRVAYLGPEATFTHMACKRRFGLSALYVPAPTISGVFAEVEKGLADFGVVPVENSTEGVVTHTLDTFVESELQICGEIECEVSHCLLSRSEIGEVQKVYSHPQAVGQCRNWLAQNLPNAAIIEVASTALAARLAKDDPTAAAVASELAGQLYELPLRKRHIEDSLQNVTRFLVLCRAPDAKAALAAPTPTGRHRTSVLFTVRDSPGILFKVLAPFAERGINLSKIESRPSKRRRWDYVFFIDVEGHASDPLVADALADLRKASELTKVLGSYPTFGGRHLVKRPLVLPNIEALRPYIPGKPIEELEREYGIKGAIKLASNENAAGASPRALDALKGPFTTFAEYPDGSCFHLRRALARAVGVTPAEIFTGGGSNEIIDLLVRTFCTPGEDEVLTFQPSFICYELSPKAFNVALKLVPLPEDSFAYSVDALLAACTPRTRIVFISNPNNPTGSYFDKAELERLVRELPEEVLLCIDEAYCEFARSEDYPDAVRLRGLREHLIVLRTFSKIYGLAALRAGYGIMSPTLVGYLDRVRLPFNVNGLAQLAALAALDDHEHVARSRAINAAGLAQVEAGLDLLKIKRFPTQANFVFVDLERDGKAVYEALLHHGVIVRHIGGPRHLRITIGTKVENERLLEALGKVLER